MKKTASRSLAILAATLVLCSFDLPKGWFPAGSEPDEYEMSMDKSEAKNGNAAATIRALKNHIRGFGTLMQNSEPGMYLGKRIRMSGYMKTKDVAGWAGFWLRTDSKGSHGITFDNMSDRMVKGTTDWKKYEIVLDIPQETTNMAYGALLNDAGQIWFDDIRFEIVSNTTPVTGSSHKSTVAHEPVNLDFEE